MLVEVMPRASVGSKLTPFSFESLSKTSAADDGVSSCGSLAPGAKYCHRSSCVPLYSSWEKSPESRLSKTNDALEG